MIGSLLAVQAEGQRPRRNANLTDERVARAQWQPARPVAAQAPVAAEELGEGEWIVDSEPDPSELRVYHPGGPDSIFYDDGCDSMAYGPAGHNHCNANVSCGWRPCVTLCFPQHGWVSFEYLMWWADGMDVPPLVTSSPQGTPPNQIGVLRTGDTEILFGDDRRLRDQFNGGRLRAGLWLDGCQTWGVQGEYFGTETRHEGFQQMSNGDPNLARPFFNVLTGQEDAQLVAASGVIGGTVRAEVRSQLRGAGVTFRRLWACGDGCGDTMFQGLPQHYTHRLDGLIGYRWLGLNEGLHVHENLIGIQPAGTFLIDDHFRTRTVFNGLDFGVLYQRTRGCWTLDLLAKLAIGNNRQMVNIRGETTATPAGGPATRDTGGLLAQTSNIGTYRRDRFAVVPELGATIGYQLTPRLRGTIGYTFIYWSNVVRPGNHVDLDVNPNFLPPAIPPLTPSRPRFAFSDSDYWVQGVSFGGEYRW